MTIVRLWHGWARGEDATSYQKLLDEEIAPAIIARDVPGLRRLDILRRVLSEALNARTTEFVTAMTFGDPAAVAAFAGPDAAASVVPPAAQALLERHDARSQHYELIARHEGQRNPAAVEVARRFLAALGRRDLVELARLVAEDVVAEDARARQTGARNVLRAIGEFAQIIENIDVVVAYGDDTEAVAVYDVRTRARGTLRAADHIVVADGRILRRSVVLDTWRTREAGG